MVRFRHSRGVSAGIIANAGIKGPSANIGFSWSFGFDIRFIDRRRVVGECQIHSTSFAGNSLK
jgi:hypothetical protein